MLKHQRALIAGKFPIFNPPILVGVPYLAPDLWVGDSVDFVEAPLQTVVYPTPATVDTAFVNGVNKGAAGVYTITSGDVTAGSLILTQVTSNSQGAVSVSSPAVNPIAVQKAWDQGLLGGNTSGATYYTVQQFLNNAGQGGKQQLFVYQNTGANYAGGFDANGWPTSAFTVEVTAQIGGLDGQLPAGTYNCSWRSVGQATSLTGGNGGTGFAITNISTTHPITHVNDGVTTYFTLTNPFASNTTLDFNGAIQYLDIPRDGVTYTYGGPEFWSTNLAFWAQQSVLRLMDLCNCTGPETTHTEREAAFPETGTTRPCTQYSLTRIARWIKAVCQYPGSRVQTVVFNAPGLMDPTVTQANNLAFTIPTMLNSVLAGIGVQIVVEPGDEPWNASLGPALIYRGNLTTMETETKCLPYYPGEVSNISSIVGNNDGTVTVTLSTPTLANIPLPDGSSFTITNGMQCIVNYQQGNAVWGAGSVIPDPNNAVDGTVNPVTVTTGGALGANQFKYTANGTPNGTLPPASGSVQLAIFFGLTSNLLKDGLTLNLYDMGNKVQVRRTYQCQQVWSAVRPQDKFLLNLQQYGKTVAAAMTGSKFSFPYSKYLGGGSDAWCWGASVAPYVKPTGLPFTGTATSGGTAVTGVPWAATAVVGDQVKINGAGAGGTNLSTTVVSGSGTTLNVADTILTTVSAGTIDYIYGPSTSVTASISGTTMTVTAGSGIMIGMMGNGTPATLAPNTRILSQLTGTAGGTGTYQLSVSQTVSSTTIAFAQTDGLVNAMLSAVPNFALTLANHIYMSMRWNKRRIVYEGGPDTQAFPNQQVAIHTNPAMQTVVSTLLDAWFNQGGQEFMYYTGAAATFVNSASGAWSALQSYTDTASPKYAAIVGYATKGLAFADAYEPGLTFGPGGTPGAYTQGISQASSGWAGFFTANGMVAAAGGSGHRWLEILRNIPRGRRYAIKVAGTDTAIGTLADIYIDGTFMGTVTLPANGNGTSAGTVAGDSTTLQLGELSRGPHRVMVDFPANRGTNVGIFSITLIKY